jgi:four helix bundle protein
MNDHGFRFQQFDIWKRAIAIGGELHDLADALETRGYRRHAEQLRAASLSISNNIAEGSGSESSKEFANYLNIAHRSAFETANIVLFLYSKSLLNHAQKDSLLNQLEQECRMITAFRRSLKL